LNLSIKAYKLVQSSIGAVTDDLQSKNKNNASLSSSHPEWSFQAEAGTAEATEKK
jgi:hypothetical protein